MFPVEDSGPRPSERTKLHGPLNLTKQSGGPTLGKYLHLKQKASPWVYPIPWAQWMMVVRFQKLKTFLYESL